MDLIGLWAIDPGDATALSQLGQVVMEFQADGDLIYSIRDGLRTDVINLTFAVDRDTIVTDQPSHPQEVRTRFAISPDGVLTLFYEGLTARFVRSQ